MAGVPLYVAPGAGAISPGSVLLTITQNGITSSSVAINIQDLPSVSSFGVQPGQITSVALDLNAMILARRLNEFQAFQLVAGKVIDTARVQAVLKSLLSR